MNDDLDQETKIGSIGKWQKIIILALLVLAGLWEIDIGVV